MSLEEWRSLNDVSPGCPHHQGFHVTPEWRVPVLQEGLVCLPAQGWQWIQDILWVSPTHQSPPNTHTHSHRKRSTLRASVLMRHGEGDWEHRSRSHGRTTSTTYHGQGPVGVRPGARPVRIRLLRGASLSKGIQTKRGRGNYRIGHIRRNPVLKAHIFLHFLQPCVQG